MNLKTKKQISFGVLAVAAVIAVPVITVVSCGNSTDAKSLESHQNQQATFSKDNSMFKLIELSRELQKLQLKQDAMKQAINKNHVSKADLDALQKKIDAKNAELATKQAEFNKTQTDLKSVQDKIAKLPTKAQFDSMILAANHEKDAINKQIIKNKELVKKLMESIKFDKDAIPAFDKKINAFEKAIVTLNSKIALKDAEIKKLEAELAKNKDKLKNGPKITIMDKNWKLNLELNKIVAEKKALEIEIARHKGEVLGIENVKQRVIQDIQDKNAELVKAQAALNVQEKELKIKENEFRGLTQEKATLKLNEVAAFHIMKRVDELKKEIKDFNNSKVLERLQKELSDKQYEFIQNRIQMKRNDDKISVFTKIIEYLKTNRRIQIKNNKDKKILLDKQLVQVIKDIKQQQKAFEDMFNGSVDANGNRTIGVKEMKLQVQVLESKLKSAQNIKADETKKIKAYLDNLKAIYASNIKAIIDQIQEIGRQDKKIADLTKKVNENVARIAKLNAGLVKKEKYARQDVQNKISAVEAEIRKNMSEYTSLLQQEVINTRIINGLNKQFTTLKAQWVDSVNMWYALIITFGTVDQNKDKLDKLIDKVIKVQNEIKALHHTMKTSLTNIQKMNIKRAKAKAKANPATPVSMLYL